MRRLVLLLLVACPILAQEPKPAPQKPQPAPPPKQTPTEPQKPKEHPLTALPYTPSLDVPSMDRTADPCVDFYQYTCGGWMKNNPIPPDQASWSVYGKLAEENGEFLWGILEEAAKPSPDRTPAQQKVGDYFEACMDEAHIEALGATPLKPVLDEIAGLKSKRDLAHLLADQHQKDYGSGWLFGFGSDQDFGDSKAQAEKDAKTVLRVETDLAKASLTRVERRNPYNLYHKMSPAELASLTPSFAWARYLADNGLTDIKTLNVTEPKFFKALDKEIKSVPLSDWKAYLRWHAAHSRAPYLSKNFVVEDFDFYRKTLRGVNELPPRWKRCVRYVDRDLGEALGQEFVRRTFSADTKAKTVDMTRRVEAAMQSEIQSLDWMTDATKQRATEKLHAVANKIGYPDRWRNYAPLDVKRGDFFGNATRATVFESRRELAKIGRPVDRGEWGMTPPTVNAYYNPQMNDINFPAGVLQPPLYDPKLDDAPNYGNTGSTIGHELTHAFDDEGRQFNAEGNLKDWWTKDDAKGFEDRINCLRDQFATYVVVDDIHINSKLTSGEDVADLGGTLLAYLAWKKQTAGQDLKDAGGFTPDQR